MSLKKHFLNNYKYIFILIPYLSIIIFMHVFKSAFLAMFCYHIGMLIVLVVFKKAYIIKEYLSGWNTLFGIPLILGASIAGVFSYFFWFMVVKNDLNFLGSLNQFGLDEKNWIFFVTYFSFVNPVFEEAFWRGFFNKKKSFVILSDFGFAFYHSLVLVFFMKIHWILIICFFLVIVSAFWRFMRNKFNGLIIPFIAHIVADISIVTAATFILYKSVQ